MDPRDPENASGLRFNRAPNNGVRSRNPKDPAPEKSPGLENPRKQRTRFTVGPSSPSIEIRHAAGRGATENAGRSFRTAVHCQSSTAAIAIP